MAVITNLDVILGAKTTNLDSGLDRSVAKVRKAKGELSFGSAVGKQLADPINDAFDSMIPGANRAREAFGSVTSSVVGMGPAGIAAGGALAGAFVAAAASAAAFNVVVNGTREAFDRIDQTSDQAKKLGMTFNELVVARRALGESSGLADGDIDSAMLKLQLNLAEAATGSGDLFEKLQHIGVDAAELLKMGPIQQMGVLSKATQELKNPTDQLNLAFELFGRSGTALVTSLREGPQHIADMERHAKAFALSLSESQAEQVGAMNNAWKRLEDVATGAFNVIAVEAAPVLTSIYEEAYAILEPIGGWQFAVSSAVDNMAMFCRWAV